jgi:hypothetical protein
MLRFINMSNMSAVSWWRILLRRWHPQLSRIHPTFNITSGYEEVFSEDRIYENWYDDYKFGNIKLHLGCHKMSCAARGWVLADAQTSVTVHFEALATDLTAFANRSVAVLYCSHLLEHLSFEGEKQKALNEFRRYVRTLIRWYISASIRL